MKKMIQGFLYMLSGRPAFACNDAAPGGRPDGKKTFFASSAIASSRMFVTLSAGKIVPASEAGMTIGQALSAAETSDLNVTPIAVDLIGSGGSKSAVADSAVSALDLLVVGASGGVKTLPTAGGTYYVVGVALADAAAGADVEYADAFQKIVVA